MIEIMHLRPDQRTGWGELWQDYLEFYKASLPPERTEITWRRIMQGDGLFGLGACIDGTLVGITHYLFHRSTWMNDVCYLQDLFVGPGARGSGCGRELIEAVADIARERCCGRLYWSTKTDNEQARVLYDTLAKFNGFIRYDYTL